MVNLGWTFFSHGGESWPKDMVKEVNDGLEKGEFRVHKVCFEIFSVYAKESCYKLSVKRTI